MMYFLKLWVLLCLLCPLLSSKEVKALSCDQVRTLVFNYYLKSHFEYRELSPALSKKTIDNFVSYWDPVKLYFLQEDIDNIKKNHEGSLKSKILRGDCSAIDRIYSLYSKRFEERMKSIPKLVGSKYTFTIDEYINIDRKTIKFPKDKSELSDRWRKRIKFQKMQYLESKKTDKEVNNLLLKKYKSFQDKNNELNTDDIYGAFLSSFAKALDPHTTYLSPSQLEEFRISTRLSLEGIGAMLRSEDGVTSIVSLVPGGAAYKTGKVKEGDEIIAVAQGQGAFVDVVGMELSDVVKLIRGRRGTEVRLRMKRDDKELVVPIVREKIQLKDRAVKSHIYEVRAKPTEKLSKAYKVGVIDLPSFYMDFEGRQAKKKEYRSSSRDMKKEIAKLKKEGVDALVLDLRSNGGGALDEAIEVSGLFGGKGVVVQQKGVSGVSLEMSYKGDIHYSGPLVLLIDRQSASASEIIAGAIQDYERGLIVGDAHSFGKGTVQNLVNVRQNLGALKVTISKFYRPSGGSTQQRGVSSDIVFPSVADYLEIGEKHFENVLPWDRIGPATYMNYRKVSPYISNLRQASKERVAMNSNFKPIDEAIEKLQNKKENRKRISLKQEKKKSQDKKKVKQTKKELLAEKKESSKKSDKVVESLREDSYLQEALYISVDYARLLDQKKLAQLEIPMIKEDSPKSRASKP